jgi:hypothetical protein
MIKLKILPECKHFLKLFSKVISDSTEFQYEKNINEKSPRSGFGEGKFPQDFSGFLILMSISYLSNPKH